MNTKTRTLDIFKLVVLVLLLLILIFLVTRSHSAVLIPESSLKTIEKEPGKGKENITEDLEDEIFPPLPVGYSGVS